MSDETWTSIIPKNKNLQKYIKRHILVKALIGSVVSGEIYET
jgi:hypothetical protein